MLKIFITLLIIVISPLSSAVNIVYRIDRRNMQEIRDAGGMWPRGLEYGLRDDNLAHHFDGTSVEGGTSNFVSTTASFRQAVDYAAALGRPNSEEPFNGDDVYIYEIRPANNFYNVDEAFRFARDSTLDPSRERTALNELMQDYLNMEEYAARGGFSQDRIIAYAHLTNDMLTQYYESGSLYSEAFWAGRWEQNTEYNPAYDDDTASEQTYRNVDATSGIISQVVNGSQPAVPLSFTCYGVSDKRKHSLFSSGFLCPAKQHMTIRKMVYDPRLLSLISEGEHE